MIDYSGFDEVAPNVYLGGYEDASRFPGAKVSVHEDQATVPPGAHWLPIMTGQRRDYFTASRLMIDAVCKVTRHFQLAGRPVMIHCRGGVERSPLVAACFLKKYGYAKSMTEAYLLIRAVRPVVEERLHWLGARVEG